MQYGEAMSKAVKQTAQDDENLRPLLRSPAGSFSRRGNRSYALWMLFRYRLVGRSDDTLLNLSKMDLRGPNMASVCCPLSPPPRQQISVNAFTKNLWHMRRFFLAFPILDAVRRELSWTHYRTLLRVENDQARQYRSSAWSMGGLKSSPRADCRSAI